MADAMTELPPPIPEKTNFGSLPRSDAVLVRARLSRSPTDQVNGKT
jgi:hypothetical protein